MSLVRLAQVLSLYNSQVFEGRRDAWGTGDTRLVQRCLEQEQECRVEEAVG